MNTVIEYKNKLADVVASMKDIQFKIKELRDFTGMQNWYESGAKYNKIAHSLEDDTIELDSLFYDVTHV